MNASAQALETDSQAASERLEESAPLALARLAKSMAFADTVLPQALPGAPEQARRTPPPDRDPDVQTLPGNADIEIGSVLAQGGMGRVFLASQRSLHREVAVKTVRPELATEARCRHLLEESMITGSLEHPNIIPVHTLGVDDAGRPFLVMKRAEGVSWGALIDDPSHPAWERLAVLDDDKLGAHVDILRSVCNAVIFAHRHGIVHRDIKPENVMVGELGEVYLRAPRRELLPRRADADGRERRSGVLRVRRVLRGPHPRALAVAAGPDLARRCVHRSCAPVLRRADLRGSCVALLAHRSVAPGEAACRDRGVTTPRHVGS